MIFHETASNPSNSDSELDTDYLDDSRRSQPAVVEEKKRRILSTILGWKQFVRNRKASHLPQLPPKKRRIRDKVEEAYQAKSQEDGEAILSLAQSVSIMSLYYDYKLRMRKGLPLTPIFALFCGQNIFRIERIEFGIPDTHQVSILK
ncbi:hypothetical protein ABW20_dc0109706 [Dactylellina cionopaga]|nr:hypothetical protein ABW20_dc0109706 [Dactylellina cionopaga]